MNSTTHYENANFLRELAENLPRILPEGSTDKSALLQRLANEELARAEYDEQVIAFTTLRSVSYGVLPLMFGMGTYQLK
ncbi:hypothetical protein RCL92_21515 [Escherichia coli]|nr:hypothetical protein [Escherichia coli]